MAAPLIPFIITALAFPAVAYIVYRYCSSWMRRLKKAKSKQPLLIEVEHPPHAWMELGDFHALFRNPVIIALFSIYLIHELSHRFAANARGLRAYFRASSYGLILAVVISIVTGGLFIVAAPGAVYVTSPYRNNSICRPLL